jgi:hypothetical protein
LNLRRTHGFNFEAPKVGKAMKNKKRTIGWRNRTALMHGMIAALVLGIIPSLTACGTPSGSGGCSVNGTYYPNGNAPNGQCTCPPIGSCRISWAEIARESQTITPLANGSILLAGGISSNTTLASAEIFDPARNTFSYTGSMNSARYNHTATLLANGQVLLCGGLSESNVPLTSAEIYDPATSIFSETGSMTTPRVNYSAKLLSTGQVLVVGGTDGSGTPLATAELYDPATSTFSVTGQ